MKFVFRNSGALVGLYVGMIFAFGGLKFLETSLAGGMSREVLTGLLACAGLLHYYYDGFIWKLSDPATRQSLNIDGETSQKSINVGAMLHLGKWLCSAVPVFWLLSIETNLPPSELARWTMLSDSLTGSNQVQRETARRLSEAGQAEAASKRWYRALQADPTDTEARSKPPASSSNAAAMPSL
ncbi:MAG: hypothetical protein CMJ78_22445 [Planctomycetaceae bacterium]|nr:hypothetical protein [Planctomycetaceae bacterium]